MQQRIACPDPIKSFLFLLTLLFALAPINHAIAQVPHSLRIHHLDSRAFPDISVNLTVFDQQGQHLNGLDESHFIVLENDRQQLPIRVETQRSDSGGVSVALIMDISGSMRDELPEAKKAAITLVDLLASYDRAALISFDRHITVEQEFTSDMELVKLAINRLQNGGGTAVYDALLAGLELTQQQDGHRAIVLLTDGRDGDSEADLDSVLAAVRRAAIPVYTIGLGVSKSRGEPALQAIARASGGMYYNAPTTAELEEVYRDIAFVISRSSYRIHYTSSNCAQDGTLRRVRILVQHAGGQATDTTSYRAPLEKPHAIVAGATDIPGPTLPITIRIDIPNSTPPVQNLVEIRLRIRYDRTYLKIQEPLANAIRAGDLFGPAGTHEIHSQAHEAAGELILTLRKAAGTGPVSGHGTLAEIAFVAAATLPDSTALNFDVDVLEARSAGACLVPFTAANLMLISDGLLVWPGDTDANGGVDLADVLVLGRFWGLSGPARTGSSEPLAWMPHVARRFPVKAATHADADGGGQISERDIVPIGLNWGKRRSQAMAPAVPRVQAVLPEGRIALEIRNSAEPVAQGSGSRHDLLLQYHPENDAAVAGLTFRLRYAASRVRIHRVTAAAFWPQSPLLFHHDDPAAGELAVGLMLPSSQSVTRSAGNENRLDAPMLIITLEDQDPHAAQAFELQAVGLIAADGRIREIDRVAEGKGPDPALPADFILHPAYPNPFNPGTTLGFHLPEAAEVELVVFDAAGRQVWKLSAGQQRAGLHSLRWDGVDLRGVSVPSGVYFAHVRVRFVSGVQAARAQKLMLVR